MQHVVLVAYILYTSRWSSHSKGHSKRDVFVGGCGGWGGGQPFYFQLHLLCAEVQHVLLGGGMRFLSVSVCASPSTFSVEAQSGIVWSAWVGDGGLRRLSHGCNFSLVEQWLELTAVPVTRPPSFLWCIVLRAEWGFTYGKKKPFWHFRNAVEGLWLYSVQFNVT